MLNSTGGKGRAFGHTPSDFRLVIHREFKTEKAFHQALAEIREPVGGRACDREIPAPP